MNAHPRFTEAHVIELIELGLTRDQIYWLASILEVIRGYIEHRPAAADITEIANRILDHAQSIASTMDLLLLSQSPADREFRHRFAFYVGRESNLGQSASIPNEEDDGFVPQSAIKRVQRFAEQLAFAAEMVALDVKGRRQMEVNPAPVALIVLMLEAARPRGPAFTPSYAEGSPFSRIVTICFSAALGITDPEQERGYERWIREYIELDRAQHTPAEAPDDHPQNT